VVSGGSGSRRWTGPGRPERGSVGLPVLACVTVVALAGAAGLGRLAGVSRVAARSQAVADLTASAAVVAERAGAQRVAAANGATLRTLDVVGGDVTVEVVSGGSVARASARPGGSGGVVPPSAPAR